MSGTIDPSVMNGLKREVFYSLMDMAGRVFVHVRFSSAVEIGRRGFVGKERENGIVLVFNASMKTEWDDYGLGADLVFGSRRERCYIPSGDMIAIYSPEAKTQFLSEPIEGATAGAASPEVDKKEDNEGDGPLVSEEGNLITVDFKKNRE